MPAFDHHNLSARVADRVRGLIREGEIPPGERINEVQLAGRLGVSRTPLREALSRLAAEQLVTVRPRRGFFVERPSPTEIRELYGMRAILDPAALGMAGLPEQDRLNRLELLNADLMRCAGDPAGAIEMDDRWHLLLVGSCPNRILIDLIHRYMTRTRPLELLYMGDEEHVEAAVDSHGTILERLRAQDLPGAVDALRRNMEEGLEPLIRWAEDQDRQRRTETKGKP